MVNGKKWINRTSDERSLPLELVGAVGVFALHTFFMSILMWLGIAELSILALIIIEILLGLGAFFCFRFMGRMGFAISPKFVQHGYLGLIKFRESYTGEIAEPGPIMHPMGYNFESVDCRQFALESEISEVRSKDGFVVKANLTAWLRVSNPMQYIAEGFAKDEMVKLLRSALFSAASRKNALDIVGDRDQICQESVKEVAELAAHYGVEVAKVAVDVQSIPEELTSLVQMLSTLAKQYPQATPAELIEIIMVNSGKITKSRSEVTNITRMEVPALDAVMAAAAKRFG